MNCKIALRACTCCRTRARPASAISPLLELKIGPRCSCGSVLVPSLGASNPHWDDPVAGQVGAGSSRCVSVVRVSMEIVGCGKKSSVYLALRFGKCAWHGHRSPKIRATNQATALTYHYICIFCSRHVTRSSPFVLLAYLKRALTVIRTKMGLE